MLWSSKLNSLVDSRGITPLSPSLTEKVKSIVAILAHSSQDQLRRDRGILDFYHHFVSENTQQTAIIKIVHHPHC